MMSCSFLLLLLTVFTNVWQLNGQGNGAVELYRNGETSYKFSSGVVRVYYNGQWGNICYDPTSWTQSESDVLCHQLGWSGGSAHNSSGSFNYGPDSAQGVIETVNCSSSSYLVLLQCTINPIRQQWDDSRDVAVSCYATRIWESLSYDGHLRLVGGDHVTEGRVEILCNGQWGTVCDDALGREEARTMCRQLGYSDYVHYDHLILPGNSTQPIWLDDVICQGTESCLATCQACPAREHHNCRHGEDFTVSCTYNTNDEKLSQTNNTCVNASTTAVPPKKDMLMILGIALGGGVALLLCALISAITCCCACHYYNRSKGSKYADELKSNGTKQPTHISATSPEVIMIMDRSPQAIRKSKDATYMNHSPPLNFDYENVSGPTVLYSPASSSGNHRPPKEPLTPPVFQGKPTF